MAIIKTYRQFTPQIADEAFLADNATVIGEVEIGAESSIWYGAVLRGDVGLIQIGRRVSIQDLAMVHCTLHRSQTLVADDVVVGHGAILHGCRIESEVLIGMNATVLDDAVIPSHCIIGANALVPERKVLQPGYLYAGVPARPIKPITAAQIEGIRASVRHYIAYSQEHRASRSL